MLKLTRILSTGWLVAGGVVAQNRGVVDTSQSLNARLKSVDMDAVTSTGGFWTDRFNLVRDQALPRMWEAMQE